MKRSSKFQERIKISLKSVLKHLKFKKTVPDRRCQFLLSNIIFMHEAPGENHGFDSLLRHEAFFEKFLHKGKKKTGTRKPFSTLDHGISRENMQIQKF
jgi:hypothetical protein